MQAILRVHRPRCPRGYSKERPSTMIYKSSLVALLCAAVSLRKLFNTNTAGLWIRIINQGKLSQHCKHNGMKTRRLKSLKTLIKKNFIASQCFPTLVAIYIWAMFETIRSAMSSVVSNACKARMYCNLWAGMPLVYRLKVPQ